MHRCLKRQVVRWAALAVVFTLASGSPLMAQKARKDAIDPNDDTRVVTSIAGADVNEILKASGFIGGKIDDDGDVLVKIEGKSVYFIVAEDQASLQARTAWSTDDETRPTAERLNEWNRSKKYSKTYFDKDRDPVLELDLDLAGGVTVARIKDFISTTQISVRRFTAEVLK
jgi:hypothetical protein